ncbi:MAG: hypothetical protein RBS91_01235 [Sulfurimonadaceae bacterium]|nr:hypothetical protein [Sulfurimonadaceae bacterium]
MKQGFGVSKIFVYLLVFFGLSLSLFGACGTDKGVLNLSGSSDSVKKTTFYYKYTPSQDGVLKLTVKNNYTSSGTRTLTAGVYGDNVCNSTNLWSSNNTISKNSTKSSSDISVIGGHTYYITIVSSSSSDTSYSITGTFSTRNITPIATNSNDMCYSKVSYSGLCTGLLNLGCKQTITLQNNSNSKLTEVDAYIAHTSLLNTGLFNECGVDNVKNKNCTQKNGIDLGPLAGVNLLNRSSVAFDMPDFSSGATHSIYTKSLLELSLFQGSNLYGTYVKDGVYYSSKISKCGPVVTSGYRDFELRHQETIIGDMKSIGNTIMVPKSNSSCKTSVTDPASKGNNEYYMCKYSDDGTMAELLLPRADSKVVWAGLYWQSIIKKTTNIDSQVIKIKKDSGGYVDVTPDVLDMQNHTYSNYNTYKSYSAFADVTDIFTLNGWNAGKYTVKDIPAAYGDKITSLGAYGAWSLVVVYDNSEDVSEKLRNVSVFDGWKIVEGVSPNNKVNIKVSGFFTPTKGDVSARVAVFAAEGDRNISGDKLSMRDMNEVGTPFVEIGNEGNAFNSSISTDGARTPKLINNMGIDIHNIEARNPKTGKSLMKTQQTSADLQFETVTTGNSKDTFWPSMIAFSTELYVPDVCYEESAFFKDEPIGEDNLPASGDVIEYEVLVTNKGNEPAKGVKLETTLDTDELEYEPNSLSIAPIPATSFSSKTDAQGDDTAEVDEQTLRFMLGTGATATGGGEIKTDEETKFRFKATIGDTERVKENRYMIGYKNDAIGVDFTAEPIQMRKCVDMDYSYGVYTPEIKQFNVVRRGAVTKTTGDPVDPADPINALYTQIVNTAFNVDVVSLGSDLKSVTAPSQAIDMTLSIVDADTKSQTLSDVVTMSFSKLETIKPATITPVKASRNAIFKIAIEDGDPIYSRDSFAIRPATFSIVTQDTPPEAITTLVGGVKNHVRFVALDEDGIETSGYNQNITASATSKSVTRAIVKPDDDCDLDFTPKKITTNVPFDDGVSDLLLAYDNVGEIRYDILDEDWTKQSGDYDKGDCIVGSSSNIADGTGRVGCMAKGETTIRYIPARFQSSIDISSHGDITYLADDKDMTSNLDLSVVTQVGDEDGYTTATNYTKDCFAKDVTVELKLDSDYADRFLLYDDAAKQEGSPVSLVVPESSFEQGEATYRYGFNFTRGSEENPFAISSDQFKVDSISDGDSANYENIEPDEPTTATFGFGRAHITNQRYSGDGGEAKVFYEVYCFGVDCDKSLLPNGEDSKNSDDIRWFINETHKASTDGKVTSSTESGGKTNVTATISGTDEQKAVISYGGAKGYPYKTTMELPADDWLIYEGNTYSVEFSRVGSWVGKHETNITSEDNNITPTTTRRIQW